MVAGSQTKSYGTSKAITLLVVVVYVITGMMQPLMLNFIQNMGAAAKLALIFPIPVSLGEGLMIFMPLKSTESKYTKLESLYQYPKAIITMTLIDVFANIMTLTGQLMIGSGVYIVIYSSLTIWTALGSFFLLKRKLSLAMWLSVVVVTVGLAISGADAIKGSGASMLLGMAVALLGTMVHSCTYWVSEYFCISTTSSIHPRVLAGYMGTLGACLLMTYVCTYTVPRWEGLFLEDIQERHSSIGTISAMYIFYILTCFAHLLAQFTAVVNVGAVTVGINKAVSSIGVFVLSDIFFCRTQSNNCITTFKVISLVIVVCGVFAYTIAAGFQGRKVQRAKEALLALELSSSEEEEDEDVIHE